VGTIAITRPAPFTSHNGELHIIGVDDDIYLPGEMLIYRLNCVLSVNKKRHTVSG